MWKNKYLKLILGNFITIIIWLAMCVIYWKLIEDSSDLQRILIGAFVIAIYIALTVLFDKNKSSQALLKKTELTSDIFSSLILMTFFTNIMLVLNISEKFLSEIMAIFIIILLAYLPMILKVFGVIKSRYTHRVQLYYMAAFLLFFNLFHEIYTVNTNIESYSLDTIALSISLIIIVDTIIQHYVSGKKVVVNSKLGSRPSRVKISNNELSEFVLSKQVIGATIANLLLVIVVFQFGNGNNLYNYINSTSAQTVAAIMAMTPIGYTFLLQYVDTFGKEKEKELDGYSYMKPTKDYIHQSRTILIFVLFTAFASIIISMISLYSDKNIHPIIVVFMMFEAILLILLFLIRFFNLDNYDQLDFDYYNKDNPKEPVTTGGELIRRGKYIKEYNELSDLVFAYYKTTSYYDKNIQSYKLSSIMNKLRSDKMIMGFSNKVKTIRELRNIVVHNNDVNVTLNQLNELKTLKKNMKKSIEYKLEISIFEKSDKFIDLIERIKDNFEFNSSFSMNINEKNKGYLLEKELKYYCDDEFRIFDRINTIRSSFDFGYESFFLELPILFEVKVQSNGRVDQAQQHLKNKFLYYTYFIFSNRGLSYEIYDKDYVKISRNNSND